LRMNDRITDFQREIRDLYEQGASVVYLKRKYHLSNSELQEIAPDAFEEFPQPENSIGGY